MFEFKRFKVTEECLESPDSPYFMIDLWGILTPPLACAANFVNQMSAVRCDREVQLFDDKWKIYGVSSRIEPFCRHSIRIDRYAEPLLGLSFNCNESPRPLPYTARD